METTFNEWLIENEDKFGSDYEKLFVENVLSKIRDIDFSSVSTQFHFTDMGGRTRYCDFVLQEGELVKIAIEIDGYDKRGTGSGMSRQDFIDWQRRQAALVSQGWFVLRFANSDVRDYPGRCRKHIELLLRRERQKSEHQAQLERTIGKLNLQLAAFESKSAATAERQKLAGQIRQLQQQLEHARRAVPLNDRETTRLEALNQALNTIQTLEKEASIMKTAIWAFAALLAVIFVTLILSLSADRLSAVQTAQTHLKALTASVTAAPAPVKATDTAQSQMQAAAASPAETAKADLLTGEMESSVQITAEIPVPVRKPARDPSSDPLAVSPDGRPTQTFQADQPVQIVVGPSCANPVGWREAVTYVNKQIAVAGKIMRITERRDIKGSPTWIEIGAAYPAKNRLTLIIWGNHRAGFTQLNGQNAVSHLACAQGTVQLYRQQLQIELNQPEQLVLNGI
ncbi:hypothetical protein ABO04_07020 [Nitrosomonas sp. HPC101]|uniref:hypothetical protein n=1 Tax=Nitrosomonas sp. HPC101 TaxID=1658667 RepID=UPI001370CECD|nr:hypothetical protein [Nitrosomonas sp. HPC101]MXS85663.1 hypothetical protein [Nitrosomonas sp. HPC101]